VTHPSRSATLYVVATPLGNLGDLSPRAAEVLRAAGVVAAEDTRRSRPLLSHAGSEARLISYHAHSGEEREETLLEILREGRDVALVTDAGTPGISDPGAALVRAAGQAGFTVVPVPGPSAVTAALSASGLPADRYLMLGFLPRRGGERERLLADAAAAPWTVAFYESPQRLVALLEDLAARCGGDRPAAVARELTKLHEEIRGGTLATLATHYATHQALGECTVLMAGRGARSVEEPGSVEETARELARRLLGEGHTRKEVARRLVDELGMARNAAYRVTMELE
jgi:16S rRNA (cytidine1402-2'-O)-methyltransferase